MPTETRTRRISNPGACAPEADATPDPQLQGEIHCVYDSPRTDAAAQQRKKDMNVNSPTFGQWLKEDGTYSATEEDGELFYIGPNETACPLSVSLEIDIQAGAKSVKVFGINVVDEQDFTLDVGDVIDFTAQRTTNSYTGVRVTLKRGATIIYNNTYPGGPISEEYTIPSAGTYTLVFSGYN